MPSLKKLVAKISSDYPNLQLISGERFRFSPPNQIYFRPNGHPLELLHELGHYLIGHTNYSSDIELIEIESRAWAKAREICPTYNIKYDEDFAEDHLDSFTLPLSAKTATLPAIKTPLSSITAPSATLLGTPVFRQNKKRPAHQAQGVKCSCSEAAQS